MKKVIKKILNFFRKKEYIPIIRTIDNNNFLENKVALVTGGSGGIGFEISKKFIESGANVIITGRNEEKLKECCKNLGNNSSYYVMDQNDIKKFNEEIQQIISIFGRIDILVNSAGIHISKKDLNFINIDESDYDSVMNLNLKSTYFLSQTVAKYMIKNKIKGHILMISSNRAVEPSWSPYSISKLGLNGITKGLAKELLKYNIIVNGIAPGPTATSMQDYQIGDSIETNQNLIERYTMPEEVAEYALLLVSDLGNTIIGDTIYMTGGRGIIDIR